MAVSVEAFLDSLIASGLMTLEQTSVLREQHPTDDGESMASTLVEQGLLTEYQAHAICTGQASHLVLGDYTILEQIGEGGMGRVFKALHVRLERYAAIKILSNRALHDRRSIDRFYQEVRIAAQIAHPNIVITYDASEQNGIHYLVMEYVDGQDIATVLADAGPLSVSQSIDVILQTARGLEYAHSRGIVHRDIKPGNLLLDHQGKVKILDMGLARMATAATPFARTAAERLTNAGQVMGTLDYMPPEQAENAKQADARSDIYALGCTLFRLLAGQVPYPAESFPESIIAHREAAIPSLRVHCPDAPEWLDDVCRKCINKRPEDRYQSVTELIQDIEGSQRQNEFLASSAEAIRGAFSLLGSYVKSREWGMPASARTASDTVWRGTAREDTSKERLVPNRRDVGQDIVALAELIDASPSTTQLPRAPRSNQRIHRLRKHRGTRIILLGALGLYFSSSFFGLLLGLVAALMGHRDLGKMQAELMNDQGRKITTIGMALGIAAVVIAGVRAIWN